jgi:hypothetical protein
MPWAGFEPTISVFERAKTVHVSDRSATVIEITYIHYCNSLYLQVYMILCQVEAWCTKQGSRYLAYFPKLSASRPPLWSSGQSSWLQILRPGFDSRHYQKKSSRSGTGSTQPREYNRGATWQESSGSCLENREYGRRDPSRWPRGILYPQMLAITSPTSGGRSVGIVCSRTQTMEFVCFRF